MFTESYDQSWMPSGWYVWIYQPFNQPIRGFIWWCHDLMIKMSLIIVCSLDLKVNDLCCIDQVLTVFEKIVFSFFGGNYRLFVFVSHDTKMPHTFPIIPVRHMGKSQVNWEHCHLSDPTTVHIWVDPLHFGKGCRKYFSANTQNCDQQVP